MRQIRPSALAFIVSQGPEDRGSIILSAMKILVTLHRWTSCREPLIQLRKKNVNITEAM